VHDKLTNLNAISYSNNNRIIDDELRPGCSAKNCQIIKHEHKLQKLIAICLYFMAKRCIHVYDDVEVLLIILGRIDGPNFWVMTVLNIDVSFLQM